MSEFIIHLRLKRPARIAIGFHVSEYLSESDIEITVFIWPQKMSFYGLVVMHFLVTCVFYCPI